MRIEESTRRYITSGVVLLVIVGLIVASVMGKKQDVTFRTDATKYDQMVAQMQEEQYEDVLAIGETLGANQESSEPAHYLMGLAAAKSVDMEKGAYHLGRVLDANPHKVEDAMFMLQYAEVLLFGDNVEEAGQVLAHCATLPAPESFPEYQTRIAELQAQLDVQS